MRYGILSDIHANLEALWATLRAMAAERVDRLLCCGDIVGYGANPNECCALIRFASSGRRKPSAAKLAASLRAAGVRSPDEVLAKIRRWRCRTVAGNHDWAVCGKEDAMRFNECARAAVAWQASHLDPENASFLAGLPLVHREGEVFLVHGAPYRPESWPYVLTLGHAERAFRHFPGNLCVIGHSHVPFAAVLETAGGCTARSVDPLKLEAGKRFLVNAGSVGQPRDGNPAACHLLLDLPTGKLSLRRIPYNVNTTRRKIRAAGLPDYLGDRLMRGE